MTAPAFVLRHLVRDVLDSTSEADPGVLAGLVLATIPRGKTREALAQTLRIYVRQVITESRSVNATVTPISPSVKVAAIRDGWQQRLGDRVHVGESHWKLLRDCTYEDLLSAAEERRQLADQNQARARMFDAWARLLTDHNVKTFGDLPTDVQAHAVGRAA